MGFFPSFPPFPIKNGDLTQDEVQNLKWRPVLDSLRSRATQTPVVLLHDEEFGMQGNLSFCFHFCAIKMKII